MPTFSSLFLSFAIVLSAIVCSCNNSPTTTTVKDSAPDTIAVSKQKTERKNTLPVTSIDTNFINYIYEFPPEVDGCAVVYAIDQEQFDEDRFIYLNNYDSISFMKIEGVLIRFVLTSSEDPDEETRILHFSSKAYELMIEEKDGGQTGDEVWANYGTLTLTDRKGKITVINFIGESGC